MMKFYTTADRKKSFYSLSKIDSVDDYIRDIKKFHLNIAKIKSSKKIHSDYSHEDKYIFKLIGQCERVVFIGVFDCSKEAFFINK